MCDAPSVSAHWTSQTILGNPNLYHTVANLACLTTILFTKTLANPNYSDPVWNNVRYMLQVVH